jgi:hypothetical protein
VIEGTNPSESANVNITGSYTVFPRSDHYWGVFGTILGALVCVGICIVAGAFALCYVMRRNNNHLAHSYQPFNERIDSVTYRGPVSDDMLVPKKFDDDGDDDDGRRGSQRLNSGSKRSIIQEPQLSSNSGSKRSISQGKQEAEPQSPSKRVLVPDTQEIMVTRATPTSNRNINNSDVVGGTGTPSTTTSGDKSKVDDTSDESSSKKTTTTTTMAAISTSDFPAAERALDLEVLPLPLIGESRQRSNSTSSNTSENFEVVPESSDTASEKLLGSETQQQQQQQQQQRITRQVKKAKRRTQQIHDD